MFKWPHSYPYFTEEVAFPSTCERYLTSSMVYKAMCICRLWSHPLTHPLQLHNQQVLSLFHSFTFSLFSVTAGCQPWSSPASYRVSQGLCSGYKLKLIICRPCGFERQNSCPPKVCEGCPSAHPSRTYHTLVWVSEQQNYMLFFTVITRISVGVHFSTIRLNHLSSSLSCDFIFSQINIITAWKIYPLLTSAPKSISSRVPAGDARPSWRFWVPLHPQPLHVTTASLSFFHPELQ